MLLGELPDGVCDGVDSFFGATPGAEALSFPASVSDDFKSESGTSLSTAGAAGLLGEFALGSGESQPTKQNANAINKHKRSGQRLADMFFIICIEKFADRIKELLEIEMSPNCNRNLF